MPHFALQTTDGNILYEGNARSLRHCVEKAVAQGVDLRKIDLRCANLSNANLDNTRMPGADLSGANLTGANLSESLLDGTDLSGASLQNTCLAWTSLKHCSFLNADFGATDVAGADLSGAVFSTLSAFSLNFIDCAEMKGAAFVEPDGTSCPMTRPPAVLLGLPDSPIIFLDRHVRISGTFLSRNEWILRARRSIGPAHDPAHDLPKRKAISGESCLELFQIIHCLRRHYDITQQSNACLKAASGLK